LSKEDEEMKEE